MDRVTLDLEVFDPAALYEEAVSSAGGSDQVGDLFGTPEAPNIARCIVELLCEHSPDTAGYEITDWH